ncbi:MAG: trehalose 6-phosphate phosphatase [Acidimicrobiia bacterium]|nr:MAG: trehalose 6-phosphate phosphatase [Acidimicrobiia bacterium]
MSGLPRRLTPELAAAAAVVASVPRLLVGVDFDGTLSRLVDDPAAARPVPGAVETLEGLARLPDTVVALVSGRRRDLLESVSGSPRGVVLVGSHGVELGEETLAHPRLADLDRRVRDTLGDLGLRIETKPATITVHTRGRSPDEVEKVRSAVARLAEEAEARLEQGKDVFELHLGSEDKGTALTRLRATHRADAVVYLGDDTTDEAAFAVLGPEDLGVKVGPGPTRAAHRVPDPEAAVELLRMIHLHRAGLA